MKEIIIRSDDLGYCEAVNYGIERTVKHGLVRSVGLMPNMEAAAHGVRLMEGTGVCIGQHTNISVGRPLTEPERIPSLVNEKGEFKSSRAYNSAEEDIVNLEEVILEIEAQYSRFLELVGHKPSYFECHAVASANLARGLQIVAQRHQLPYLGMPQDGVMRFKNAVLRGYCDYANPQYDPAAMIKQACLSAEDSDEYPMIVLHAGYLDDYLLRHSSLTIPRTMDVEAACRPELAGWLEENGYRVITYDELGQTER